MADDAHIGDQAVEFQTPGKGNHRDHGSSVCPLYPDAQVPVQDVLSLSCYSLPCSLLSITSLIKPIPWPAWVPTALG